MGLLRSRQSHRSRIQFRLLRNFRRSFKEEGLPRRMGVHSSDRQGRRVRHAAVDVYRQRGARFTFPPMRCTGLSTMRRVPHRIISNGRGPFARANHTKDVIRRSRFIVIRFHVFSVVLTRAIQVLFHRLLVRTFRGLLGTFAVTLVRTARVKRQGSAARILSRFLFRYVPSAIASGGRGQLKIVSGVVRVIQARILRSECCGHSMNRDNRVGGAPTNAIFSSRDGLVSPPCLAFFG